MPAGRADVLLTDDGRDGLFEAVIEPLVRRYGPAGARADLGSAIAAYEFMNEPDFVIVEWEADLSSRVRRPLSFEVMAEMVSRLSDLVHAEHPGVLATLGCARLRNLWAWDDDAMGLDVLQVHRIQMSGTRNERKTSSGRQPPRWASAVPSFWESFRATDLHSTRARRRRGQRRWTSIWSLR